MSDGIFPDYNCEPAYLLDHVMQQWADAEAIERLLAECVPASRLSICARILVTIRRIVR